jgi:hypothetical protein
MHSIARIGDPGELILVHRAEVEKRPPNPAQYTGMNFVATLGENDLAGAAKPVNRDLRNDKPADSECFDCSAQSGAEWAPSSA